MKLALSFLALAVSAQLSMASDRYLVTFKSDQGFQAMSQYLNSSWSQMPKMQKSLKYIRAVVVDGQNNQALESLKNNPEVFSVEKEYFIPAPKPINGFRIAKVPRPQLMVTDQEAQALVDNTVPVFKAGASTPWGIIAVHAGAAWAGSEAGAKARVLVLDTGIDVTHPVIAANFEKGKNFAENAKSGAVDPENFVDVEGHGTHCSGTILGAFNSETGFTGVAPKAKLLMARVCSSEGCSSISLLEGINWGIEQHVDVMSMSLGGPMASGAELRAMQTAEDAGIVVVAASGNSATQPNYSYDKNDPKCKSSSPFQPSNCGISYPAAFPTVISVGALNSTLEHANFSQWGPELKVSAPGVAVVSSVPMGSGRISDVTLTIAGVGKKVVSSAFSGTELFATPVVNQLVLIPGMGRPADYANLAVEGKFALVSRGEIKFAEKVQNAIAAKAVGVLIYNNAPGLMQGAISEDGSLLKFPVVMIEQVEAQSVIAALSQGQPVSAAISLAPSDYASFDGTSMATPHVAGVVALIRSANKKLTPAQVRQILTSTAMALSPNDTNQFGAGVVQADKAVQAAMAQP